MFKTDIYVGLCFDENFKTSGFKEKDIMNDHCILLCSLI